MAIGKNKRGKKKGARKKVVDPFSRKDWYDVLAQSNFQNRVIGKTPVTKYTTPKAINDNLIGRTLDVSLGDLNENAKSEAFRRFRLRIEWVDNNKCYTRFFGMRLSTDKVKNMARKWITQIKAFTEVKTSEGFLLRVFCTGYTARRRNQVKKTSYAKRSQVKLIRKKMIDIIQNEVQPCNVNTLVDKLIPDSIAKQITESCEKIYPLQNVYITKVKVINAPKMDATSLSQLYGDGQEAESFEAAQTASELEDDEIEV